MCDGSSLLRRAQNRRVMLPFTREQFFGIFVDYNAGVWPVQVLAYLIGVGSIALLIRPSRMTNRVIAGGLAALWVWTGVAYHGLHFSTINSAAYAFAALFVLQGLLLLHFGVSKARLRLEARAGSSSILGWALIVYAEVIYPLVGIGSGHRLGDLPAFGVTPCPLTLFTIGLFLLATEPVPRWLLVIPIFWSLIGGSASFLLGVPQDWPLLFSGVAIVLILWRRRSGSVSIQSRSCPFSVGQQRVAKRLTTCQSSCPDPDVDVEPRAQ